MCVKLTLDNIRHIHYYNHMIRTQIYLPEQTHANLQRIAKEKGVPFSQLIRQGAEIIVKKTYGKLTPQQKALRFFANPPKKYRIPLTGKQAVDLIREDRDE